MVELGDTLDLGSNGYGRKGSSPFIRTSVFNEGKVAERSKAADCKSVDVSSTEVRILSFPYYF